MFDGEIFLEVFAETRQTKQITGMPNIGTRNTEEIVVVHPSAFSTTGIEATFRKWEACKEVGAQVDPNYLELNSNITKIFDINWHSFWKLIYFVVNRSTTNI